jgi:hypothetical protein
MRPKFIAVRVTKITWLAQGAPLVTTCLYLRSPGGQMYFKNFQKHVINLVVTTLMMSDQVILLARYVAPIAESSFELKRVAIASFSN